MTATSDRETLLSAENRLSFGDKLLDPGHLPEGYQVRPGVCEEVEALSALGRDVALVDTPDRHALDPDEQARVDAEIGFVEQNPEARQWLKNTLANNEGAVTWFKAGNGAAIGLFPAYTGVEAETLGEGIQPDAYEAKLFPVHEVDENGQDTVRLVSAEEMLVADAESVAIAKGKPVLEARESALGRVEDYKKFIGTPFNSNQELRDILGGSVDGRAVRTRAYAAIEMAGQHFEERGGLKGRRLTSASLACGAASPVYEMANRLETAGAKVENIILADQDPMALASAHSLAEDEKYGVSDRIDIHKLNLMKDNLTDHIEPHSVDVVDILGLFEYIPELKDGEGNTVEGRDYATQLLARAKEIVKPGGVILFGNMVPERPQETYFYDVLQWPKLYQRSVDETLEIAARAGLDTDNARVRIPAKEGVYAVYAIPVGEEGKSTDDAPDKLAA